VQFTVEMHCSGSPSLAAVPARTRERERNSITLQGLYRGNATPMCCSQRLGVYPHPYSSKFWPTALPIYTIYMTLMANSKYTRYHFCKSTNRGSRQDHWIPFHADRHPSSLTRRLPQHKRPNSVRCIHLNRRFMSISLEGGNQSNH